LKVKLKRLESATDIKFFDAGNCENGVSVSKDDFPLFEKIRTAADTAIRVQWGEHQKAIDAFPADYVEKGQFGQ
jgi:hypothetical protein